MLNLLIRSVYSLFIVCRGEAKNIGSEYMSGSFRSGSELSWLESGGLNFLTYEVNLIN